jgi:hypothetical protein
LASRPKFRKPPPTGSSDTPEEVFYSLTARAKSHGYLRGPQQDALRNYVDVADAADVAFELPTGSGKTLVGLLIAEWQRRRNRGRVAFLTLTNQLAAQVLDEAKNLGLPTADLRGKKEERSKAEEGRFLGASAIGVSTYSNLFNVGPIVKECECLVLDDAHGGGEYAASMWTMRLRRSEYQAVFDRCLAVLTPLMTEAQFASIFDATSHSSTTIVDLGLASAAREHLIEQLKELPRESNARYGWSYVRAHLAACHILVSRDALAIRPYIPATYDHPPFAGAKHRLYLSATLGDAEDLRRVYAIEKIEAVRAAKEQDGRRYVFIPGLALNEDETWASIKAIWHRLSPRRVVAIAPSFPSLNKLRPHLESAVGAKAKFLQAKDIEESLTPFTGSTDAVLGLANRYDGLDLPDDDCRLLILSESPRATNELETNLSSNWKLGPALRWREATRLVQGMGRCTRNATDFAVILLVGESMINAATNSSLLRLLPPSLQKEIQWGASQIKDLKLDDASFAEMVLGLVEDQDYRQEADQAIAEVGELRALKAEEPMMIASREVAHAKAFWSGDYSRAHELAVEIADRLSGPEWAGYRAWWLYLASLAGRHADNPKGELDALRRAKGTGINSGWLDHLLRVRSKSDQKQPASKDELAPVVAERVWNVLEELGWAGKRFGEFSNKMLEQLADVKNYKAFHEGLESLGRLVGAQASRPTEQGDPDVIWRLADRVWICFEAKSEKLKEGAGLSKKDILEAKGHVNWVRFFETQGKTSAQIMAVIVAPTSKIQSVAEPHKESLYFLDVEAALAWAKDVYRALTQLRTKYSGEEFAGVREKFARDLEHGGLDAGTTLAKIRATPL